MRARDFPHRTDARLELDDRTQAMMFQFWTISFIPQTQSIHLPPGLDLLKGTVGSKWQTWSEHCPVSSNISWSETYWILLVKRPNINKDTNPPSDILYGNFRHSPLPDYQSYLLTCIITYFYQVKVFFKKIKILSFIYKPSLPGWTLCEGGRRRRRKRRRHGCGSSFNSATWKLTVKDICGVTEELCHWTAKSGNDDQIWPNLTKSDIAS